ncbi:MAG: serine protein kinase RIO [Candidatus Hydrothermarchaeaceae archaeon]
MKLEELEARADEARRKIKGLEDLKVASEVFDTSTLLTLYYLANKGTIEVLRGVIKTGKESNVFLAEVKGRSVAVKIHRITTSNYRNMLRYLDGDPRFRGIKRSKRSVVYTWVQKEFKNLERALRAGVAVPRPMVYKNNVLVMEFLGKRKRPYPMLKEAAIEDPEVVFEEILKSMNLLYCRANLVHSDLSEYNILMKESEPVLIDMSHAVVREHPLAGDYLKRDVGNVVRFFGRYLDLDFPQVFDRVTRCDDGVREDTEG